MKLHKNFDVHTVFYYQPVAVGTGSYLEGDFLMNRSVPGTFLLALELLISWLTNGLAEAAAEHKNLASRVGRKHR